MTRYPIRLVFAFLTITGLILVPGVVVAVPCVPITLCTASNGNTNIEVDTADDEDGLETWQVDGVNQVFENFFYLRFGLAGSLLGPEDSLVDMLPLLSTDATGNVVTLGYGDGTLAVDLVYTVLGGALGSGMSTVQTTVNLTNLSLAALDLVWFNNVDLDLNQTSDNETGIFTAPGTITQTDENGLTTATYTSSLAPTAWQIDTPGTVQGPLDDATVTTNLLNIISPFGPADVAFAFQHNFSNLGAGNSVSYTTTLSLTQAPVSVPEPGTMVLFGTGVLGFLAWTRRRTAFVG